MSSSFGQPSKIAWREPLGARARIAFGELRRRWHLPVGAGVSLVLVGVILLAIWAYNLGEPFNLRAAAVICALGLLVVFLLTINDFIPRSITLGDQAIRIGQPELPLTIRYADLRECELTTQADREFRGLGKASDSVFEVLWSSDIDPELVRTFLHAKGVNMRTAPPNEREIPAARSCG